MSELSQSLSNLLPSQVTLTAVTPNLAAGGPGVGDRSYFDVQISDDSGILSGAVDAFCIDTDFPLSYEAFDLDNDGVYGESGVTVPNLSQALGLPNSTTYSEGTPQPFTASVYSSYDQTVLSDGLGGIIEKPENLDLVNWLLNDPNGQLAGYTTAEIQVAIWTLMDTPQLTADTTTGLNVFFGGFDQANVDAIVALAQSEGEGFVPGPGQKVAIILVPDGNSTGADGADTDPDGQPDGRPDAQIIITAVELAKLGDFVFEDSDADGLQDAGETGIAGVTVNLLADVDGDGTIEADEVVDSTTTDANGEYHFTVLPGDYQVQFETPDGYMASPGNQGGDDTTDSDGPLSDVASLDPGEVDTSIDAGFFRKAGLGDFVFNDLDQDGIQDANEAGVSGVEVHLLDGNGNVVASTTTDGSGGYSFTDLIPGDYQVKFTAPDGFVFTTANAGDDALDSDADPNTGLTQTVTLTSGEFNGTLDAGIVELAKLGDYVFEDKDADGIQDADEIGIAGATVNLLQNGQVVASTTTDADGKYHFTDLLPGDYQVEFVTPDGFDMASPANQGGDDAVDSDGPLTAVVTLGPGESDLTLDAGFFKKAGLGDFVFNDLDQDGIQDANEAGVSGVEVHLLDGNGNAVASTTTDGNGGYSFTGLTPGDYQVKFTAPDGFVFTTANAGDDALDSDADPNTGLTQTVTLTSGEFNGTLDAGIVELAKLGDYVFEDKDADGIQDADESGIAGATVNLLQNGQVIASTTTDADGKYHFTDLLPGDYQVEFVTPDGFDMASPANQGGDDAVDSDGPLTAVVTLGPGESDLTLDAGFFKKAGLGDFVFNDLDQDGIQDANEAGVSGVEVHLLDGNGNVVASTTTDGSGGYSFTDLIPGDYQVKFTAPDGFVFTTANAGDDALDSDADPNTGLTQTVTLTSGEFNGTLDAGVVELKPAIDIEKFVNGIDVTDINNLPEIAAGSNVTFTYTVTNTGNVAFNQADVVVLDDNGTVGDTSDDFVPTLVASSDVGNDGILSAGETWLYTSTPMAAQNLTTTTNDQDVRFVFNGWSNTTGAAGNVRTFTQDGVSVDVSAFSSNKRGGDWRTAYLGLYNGGLGVTNQGEGGSSHRLDNSGNQDYILFEFDQSVTVDRAFLDFVDCDSDISIWIGDRNGDINSANSFANFLSGITQEDNFVGHDYSRWADFNNGEISGNTLVISGFTGHSNDAFKLRKLDIFTPGESIIGDYINTVTVTAGGVSDSDLSGYTNPEELPEPGITIKKFVNGFDADTADDAVEIAAGSEATFTYVVKNTGNVGFAAHEVILTDDNGTPNDSSDDFTPTFVGGDLNNNNILDAGEAWIYSKSEAAQNLVTTTPGEDVLFTFNGWSHTTGSAGNVRTFSQDGVSVDVSAFSSNKNGGDWRTAYLGLYNGGLGVTNQGEGGSSHRLDNSGNQDYILFEFDQSVTVDRAFLDFVDCDSDISIWIGDRNGDINSANSFANFLSGITQENNFVGHDYSRWADFNNGETSGNTLVISGFTGHSNDAFKLKMLDIITQGETLIGNYQNTVTVTAGGVVSATDTANYTNPDTPVFTPNHVVMEAEDMHLCDYTTEHVGDVASGGEVIRLTGHDGYAYSAFTGPSGYYQVEVTYFDENDGCATGQIKIGGKTVDTWSFNQNLPSNWVSDSNKVTRTVSEAIYIEQGEQIKLSGWFNGGEYARFDAIKFTEVEAPQHYLYEAEEMDLYNYGTEHASFASGGELIKLSGHWGYAATEFTGTDGKYDIIIGYYDENDGSARAQLKVGDDLLTAWTFSDNHLGSNVASSGNLVEKTYAGVDLLNGDELKLFGQMDAGEFARIDYIKVVAVNNSLGSGGGQTNGPDLQSTDLFAYVNDHAPGLVPVLSDALI